MAKEEFYVVSDCVDHTGEMLRAKTLEKIDLKLNQRLKDLNLIKEYDKETDVLKTDVLDKNKSAAEITALKEEKAKSAAEITALKEEKAKSAAEITALKEEKAKSAAEITALKEEKAKLTAFVEAAISTAKDKSPDGWDEYKKAQ